MSMLRFEVVSRLPRSVSMQDLACAGKELARALALRRPSTVSLRFVSPTVMATINKQQRGKRTATDVLSFAVANEVQALTPTGVPRELGDLIVCPAYAAEEARRRGVDVREEYMRLIVHGVLHISGYDHDTHAAEERMFALQERLVSKACS